MAVAPGEIPEYAIKRQIITWLKYNGVFAWVQHNAAIYDPSRKAFRRQSFGQRRGVSDILGVWKGRLLAIEVKTKTGKLSEHQEEFLKDVNRVGGIGFVARSIDDVVRELNARG